MRCAPVELGHSLINKREAQGSFDMVSCRQEVGPFVLSTNLGLQELPTIPDRDGTVARALFDQIMNHGRRLFKKERAINKHSNSPSTSA
jgi:hypothetical protein